MSLITSKLQVTVPKAIALKHGLGPGSEVTFESAGDVVFLRPAGLLPSQVAPEERARRFWAMMARADARGGDVAPSETGTDRGWTREELYDRDVLR